MISQSAEKVYSSIAQRIAIDSTVIERRVELIKLLGIPKMEQGQTTPFTAIEEDWEAQKVIRSFGKELFPDSILQIRELSDEIQSLTSPEDIFLNLMVMAASECLHGFDPDIPESLFLSWCDTLELVNRFHFGSETFKMFEKELLIPQLEVYRNHGTRFYLKIIMIRLNVETVGLLEKVIGEPFKIDPDMSLRQVFSIAHLPKHDFDEWQDGFQIRLRQVLEYRKKNQEQGMYSFSLGSKSSGKDAESRNLNIFPQGRREYLQTQPETSREWTGSKSEFARFVCDEYDRNKSHFKSLRDASNSLFKQYIFQDKAWTKEKCYDLVRKS